MDNTEPTPVQGYQMEPDNPLHRLYLKRMKEGGDLKIIIVAEDSRTNAGKTTLAGWLGLSWNQLYADEPWQAETNATLDPLEYFELQRELPPGSVELLDDAEELDARRATQHENVEFSQRWMLMRVRQIVHIITLPSIQALDNRIEELADVLIVVTNPGVAVCHDIRVQTYGDRKTMTKKAHWLKWPDISTHPELQELHDMKEDKIDRKLSEDTDDEEPSPDEVERETKVQIAQNMRDQGMTVKNIAETLGYSKGWVSEHTTDRRGEHKQPEAV